MTTRAPAVLINSVSYFFWDNLWISWFVQYQPNITYNQISDMIGNLVVLVSVDIFTMMEMLRYVTAWARWSTQPPLPTSPLRASFTTRCQLELEHKFRMDDWKQEDGTVKLVLILHEVWIVDLATIWIGPKGNHVVSGCSLTFLLTLVFSYQRKCTSNCSTLKG